jgi:hypothetical protein
MVGVSGISMIEKINETRRNTFTLFSSTGDYISYNESVRLVVL